MEEGRQAGKILPISEFIIELGKNRYISAPLTK